jgi:hypothetical protein
VTLSGTDPANTFSMVTSDGTFSFDVPADSYVLAITNGGTNYANGYWCGGVHLCWDKASASVIVASAGGSYEADPMIDQVYGISGTVLTHGGSPSSSAYYGFDTSSPWTQIGWQGSISVPLQPGPHTLAVKAAPGAPLGYYAAGLPGNWTQLAANATAIVVPYGAAPDPVTITLPAMLNLSGTVSTVGGAPVGGGSVGLYQDNNVLVEWIPVGQDGTWSVSVPDPSVYSLLANAYCPNLSAWYQSTPPGYTLDQASASPVSTVGQDTTGIALTVASCPTITGTIRDHTGAPLGGAIVETPTGYGSYLATTTAADGTYSLAVPPGQWEIEVVDRSGIDVSGWYSVGGWTLNTGSATALNVTMSGITGIDVQLPSYRYITGTVKTPDSLPAAGVQVGPSWSGAPTTAADGTYSLRVPPGSYTVSFSLTDRTMPGYWGGSGYVASQTDAVPVSTVAGDVGGIDVTVPFWPRITGTVRDVAGNPVAGAVVALGPTAGWSAYMSAMTGADGTYTVFNHWNQTGAWTLKASKPNWYAETSTDLTLSGADISGVDFSLHAFPAVEGTVMGSDGTPLSGIWVETVDRFSLSYTNLASATTDASGHYRLVLPIGAGQFALKFGDPTNTHATGYLGAVGFSYSTATSLSVATDQVLSASIVLPTYHKLTGKLIGPDGHPVAGAQLSAYLGPSNAYPIVSSYTASDGSFSLRLFTGPWYIAVASPPGYTSGWLGSEGFNYSVSPAGAFAMPDHDLTRTVGLPPSLHVSGRVTHGTASVVGVEVDLLLNGAAYASTRTASDGTWSIPAAPGAYLVGVFDSSEHYTHGFVGATGFVLSAQSAKLVLVGSASVTGVSVSLPLNKTVSGKVLDTQGVGHSSVYVEAWVNGSYYTHGWSSTGGAYTMPVPSGSVRLWIFDNSLKLAPGWRTSTSLTANYASSAATTVGSSSVTGITIKAPAPRFISGAVTGDHGHGGVPGAFVSANAYGAEASLAYAGSGGAFKLPVLPGTYTVWSDTIGLNPGQPAPWAGGWYRAGGNTPDPAAATKITPPSTGSKLTILLLYTDMISGTITGPDGYRIEAVVVLFSGGTAYDSVATKNGDYVFGVPPGTYRVGVYDPYGVYREGWYGASGYVADYADAADIVVGPNYANPNVQLPLETPPPAPTSVTAVPFHASALVSWTNPSTGSRPIIHATVTASPGGNQCTAVGTTSCLVTGLTNGVAYTFTVTVSTNVGSSPASAASAPVTPSTAVGMSAAPAN